MDDAELPSRQHRAPDHRSLLPERTRTTATRLRSSARLSAPRLIGADTGQIQRALLDAAAELPRPAPAYLSALERASAADDLSEQETWFLAAVPKDTKQQSLFSTIWRRLV